MDFIYDDAIDLVDLRPASVNGKDGWSLVIEWDEAGTEAEQELLFEDTETLDAFGQRLATLLTREEIWDER